MNVTNATTGADTKNSAWLSPLMRAVPRSSCCSCSRMPHIDLTKGSSHPYILTARAPPTTSDVVCTLLSVSLAVALRFLDVYLTRDACRGIMSSIMPHPARLAQTPISATSKAKTIASSCGPPIRKGQKGAASSNLRTSLLMRLTTCPVVTPEMEAPLRRNTLECTASMHCCRMWYPIRIPFQNIWWWTMERRYWFTPNATR
mmetsp:Transcript_20505/g.65098  ORF Transcript_20505/g.65098 Transcript_20505/m.65098 type:complete len:202 (+) Transcript_20505:244-849(+)